MKILPNLNLNKHPQECTDGSLINANNIIVSSDNAVIQNEPELVNSDVNKLLKEYYKDIIYKIIYILSCNKEIVIFVKPDNIEDISLIRYNEKFNKIQFCTNIDYSGGKFIGTFTYNKTNLIIAFSEYSEDDSLNIPLRTINLGEFDKELDEEDKNQLENKNLHYTNPKIKIPTINHTITNGNSYKGWYFIFIRYKLSKDTYTKWYNTNYYFLLDCFEENKILDYYSRIKASNTSDTDGTLKETTENMTYHCVLKAKHSNTSNIISYSPKLNIINIDNNYLNYQLGFVITQKTNTIVKRTNDISTNIKEYLYNNGGVIDISLEDIVNNNNNYYNIHSITNRENKLYISNYKEFKENDDLIDDLKNINLYFNFIRQSYSNQPEQGNINTKSDILYAYNTDNSISYGSIKLSLVNDRYFARNTIFYWKLSKIPINGIKRINTSYIHIYNLDPGSTIDIYYGLGGNNHKQILANQLYIDYTEERSIACDSTLFYNERYNSYKIRGKIYIRENGILVPLCEDEKYIPYRRTDGKIDQPLFFIGRINEENLIEKDANSNEYGFLFLHDSQPIEIIDGVEYLTGEYDCNFKYELEQEIIIEKNYDGHIIIPNNMIPEKIFKLQWHNFFIHFIDEYGNITKGYNFSNFNIHYINYKATEGLTINAITNKLDNLLLQEVSDIDKNYIISAKCSIDSIPKGYIGWFVSYEKLEQSYKNASYFKKEYEIHEDASENNVLLYNELFNYDDSIDFKFDILRLLAPKSGFPESNDIINGLYAREINNTIYLNPNIFGSIDTSSLYKIKNKSLQLANTYNNLLDSTRLKVHLLNVQGGETIKPAIDGVFICYNSDTDNLYVNSSKTLIPCSNICYKTYNTIDFNNGIIVNTKDGFYTKHNNIVFGDKNDRNVPPVYFDDNTLTYKRDFPALNLNDKELPVIKPFYNYNFYFDDCLPHEYFTINREPEIIAFPILGLDTTNIYEKSFKYGKIIRPINTIDLFEQRNYKIGDCYPKTLDWYDKNKHFINVLSKTIRRSNIFQDESNVNKWRQFPIESYKIISENKGDIIKIVSIGNLLLVHTQYSLFMFNGADSIKSQNSEDNSNNNIQLASIDIWDIDYKEIFTSTYGRAGLSKQEHSIVGDFGYIWYDYESRRIYRFDNNSIIAIDDNIKNFIYKLKGFDLNIIEDINRNRLLFNFYKEDTSYILSYNYSINSFVSLHSYEYSIGYNTKNNIYIVTKDNIIKDFNDNFYDVNINNKHDDNYNNSSINIICNADFSKMKSIDSIVYNIRKVVNKTINDFLPVEGLDNYYAGDSIRIYNNLFDTGLIDISNNEKNNINEDYKKPYWRLGNWHFNNIRNSLLEAKDSRIYGNYFIIQLNFNTNKQIEIESIDIKLNNSALK